MALEIKQATVNKSRSYPLSVATQVSHPLAFATGRFSQDRRQTPAVRAPKRSRTAQRTTSDPALAGRRRIPT